MAKSKTTERAPSHGASNKFHVEFLNTAQKLAYACYQQHDVLFLMGPAGVGKALPMNAKLYTKESSIEMKDVKVGMQIANPDGGFSVVEGVFPQGMRETYRIHFHDGVFVDCCGDHLWSVSSNCNGWRNKVVDTKYIANHHRTKSGRRHLFIEATKPVEHSRKDYLIDPYLMGIFITEGNLTNSNVVFTTSDREVLEHAILGLQQSYCCKSKGIDHRIVKHRRSSKPNIYKEELKRVGLWGKLANEKHIPVEYLFGSVHQRIALLQGLMDGDGTVDKKGRVEFNTSSDKLSNDFSVLVNSLGGICKIKIKERIFYKDKKGKSITGLPSYRCRPNLPNEIELFMLTRKKRRVKARSKYFPKRIIDRVEVIGKQLMQCISVDHCRNLYLTDNYVVTHNTHLAMAFAINEVLQKSKKRIVLTRPVIEAGENLGFLPGELENKVYPYMLPLQDCMDRLVGEQGAQREYIERAIEFAPLAYLRGRTFYNSVCILDEAQNATEKQLKMFLTRFGEGSKIIITGDPKQSDLTDKAVPLANVVNRLESVPGIGIVRFKGDSVVRHPLVSAILEKLEE